MFNMFNIDKIKDAITDLTDGQMASLWNDYCEASNHYDDRIEYNDIDDLLCGCKPSEVLSRINTDKYNDYDNYCAWDGYGCLYSFDYADDDYSPFDLDSLAQWIYDNEDALGYLDEYDISDHFNYNSFVDSEMGNDDVEQFLISNDVSFDEDDDEITRADLVKDYLEDLMDNVDEITEALSDLGWLFDIEERVLEYFN
jgi:hypothetical protein